VYSNSGLAAQHLVEGAAEYMGGILVLNHDRCAPRAPLQPIAPGACAARAGPAFLLEQALAAAADPHPHPPFARACRTYVQFRHLAHVLQHGELPPAAAGEVPDILATFGSDQHAAEHFAAGMTGASTGAPARPPAGCSVPRPPARAKSVTKRGHLQGVWHLQPWRNFHTPTTSPHNTPTTTSAENFRLLAQRFDFSRFASLGDFGGSLGCLAVAVAQQVRQCMAATAGCSHSTHAG
jgi:hypothetical protein